MNTLQETLSTIQNKGGAGASLRKHLSAAGINDWEDLTRAALYDLKDHAQESLAPGSAKQLFANLRALLSRYQDELPGVPDDWRKILTAKGDTSRSTFLTREELERLEHVPARSAKERIVKYESLIEAYTGARISDVMTFTAENFQNGYLVYTSKKTRVTATVPVSEKTRGWIEYAQEHRADEPTLMGRNRIIRRLAQRAGICEKVKTRRGGEDIVSEKWEVLTSHCFRKSCASNMALAGATLTDIRLTLGHTNEAMSSRYVVCSKPNLSPAAIRYFQ